LATTVGEELGDVAHEWHRWGKSVGIMMGGVIYIKIDARHPTSPRLGSLDSINVS
jgi:hypothetical protein